MFFGLGSINLAQLKCVISVLGLYEYDPDGTKAGALEDAIGIKVIRHSMFCHYTLEKPQPILIL